MLDHQELQSEDDPPDTGDDSSARQGDNSGDSPPHTLRPIEHPQSPYPAYKPPKDWEKVHKITKFCMEALGLAALIVYTIFSVLQWAQIRYTNQLTARALDGSDKALGQTTAKMQAQIDAADTANSLTRSMVKSEQQAILQLTIPSNPSSLDLITSGLSAQWVNKGKVDATNFKARAVLRKSLCVAFGQ